MIIVVISYFLLGTTFLMPTYNAISITFFELPKTTAENYHISFIIIL